MDSGLTDRTAVILDRHPMWVQAFSQLLNRVGVEVLGHTTDPDELVRLIEKHHPDVLVIELDVANEQRAVSDLRNALEAHPELRAIVVSERADLDMIESLFAEGASAYCTKAAAPDDFAAAIRQSFHRSVYLAGVKHGSGAGAAGWRNRERQMDLT